MHDHNAAPPGESLTLRLNPPVSSALLNERFGAARPGHRECDFAPLS